MNNCGIKSWSAAGMIKFQLLHHPSSDSVDMSSSPANEVELIGNDVQGRGGRKERGNGESRAGYMRENGRVSV